MFYIRKFKLKDFEPTAQELVGCINGWKVYGWCSENEILSCELLLRAKQIDLADAKHLINGMAKLMKKACVGKLLENMYDDKQCHESFTYTRASNGSEHKVYRIWPGGNVRIHFSYGNDKSIIVFYGLLKRKDKLSDGEKNELQTICETFLIAQEQNQLITLEKT